MYLTPERFRTMGFGTDLSDPDSPSDIELRSAIHRATALVNSYCSVPLIPVQFDFRGGTVIDEAREWVISEYDVLPKPYRFWPVFQPVKVVSQMRIYSTPDVYTQIDAAEIFINNTQGYVEVSSLKLTQFGIFGAGLMTYLIGMYNPVAKLSYTYGWAFQSVNEPLDPSDAATYRAQNQWWADDPAPIIYLNGVIDATGTVDLDEGTVTFPGDLPADSLVTATYTYKLHPSIAQASGLVVADLLAERLLTTKDMGGVSELTAGEITIRRNMLRAGSSTATMVATTIPMSAQVLLAPFVFNTAR